MTNGSNTIDEEEKNYMPNLSPPNYLTIEEIQNVIFSNKSAILNNNCLGFNRENGAVELMNSEADKEMKNVFSQIVLKLGKSFFVSNIQGLSLPAGFNEGRSETDRALDPFRILSIYFTKAANTSDKIERMKLISVACFASIYLNLRMKKSFNPLLGETSQATLEDGSRVFLEQISHHPPMMCLYCVGKDNCYIYSHSCVPNGDFKINFILLNLGLKAKIVFKDGQTIKIVNIPKIKITGLIQGTRSSYFKGYHESIDVQSNLRTVIYIDFGKKKHYIGSTKTHTRDQIEGIIYESTNINIPCNPKGCRIEDLTDIKEKKVFITGSIFDKIDCDGKNYWHIDKILPLKMYFDPSPIPSDWRYREDLILVRRKDCQAADKWKDAIEIRQRRDRKERENFEKAHIKK